MTPEQVADLVRTKTLVEDMHHRLFGNGQPGILDKQDRRIKTLEEVEAKGKGVIWTVGIIVTVIEIVVHAGGKLWH